MVCEPDSMLVGGIMVWGLVVDLFAGLWQMAFVVWWFVVWWLMSLRIPGACEMHPEGVCIPTAQLTQIVV